MDQTKQKKVLYLILGIGWIVIGILGFFEVISKDLIVNILIVFIASLFASFYISKMLRY
ncbi:MAG: hypothetical protein ACK4YO_02575 [Candidatus Altarchaeaceae archaeon]